MERLYFLKGVLSVAILSQAKRNAMFGPKATADFNRSAFGYADAQYILDRIPQKSARPLP